MTNQTVTLERSGDIALIVDRLANYAGERGDAFGYWTTSALLKELAGGGRRISDWQQTS